MQLVVPILVGFRAERRSRSNGRGADAPRGPSRKEPHHLLVAGEARALGAIEKLVQAVGPPPASPKLVEPPDFRIAKRTVTAWRLRSFTDTLLRFHGGRVACRGRRSPLEASGPFFSPPTPLARGPEARCVTKRLQARHPPRVHHAPRLWWTSAAGAPDLSQRGTSKSFCRLVYFHFAELKIEWSGARPALAPWGERSGHGRRWVRGAGLSTRSEHLPRLQPPACEPERALAPLQRRSSGAGAEPEGTRAPRVRKRSTGSVPRGDPELLWNDLRDGRGWCWLLLGAKAVVPNSSARSAPLDRRSLTRQRARAPQAVGRLAVAGRHRRRGLTPAGGRRSWLSVGFGLGWRQAKAAATGSGHHPAGAGAGRGRVAAEDRLGHGPAPFSK